MQTCPQPYIDFANELADEAGKIARRYYRKPYSTDYKQDKSPVTLADLQIEKKLRSMISKKFPKHGILGEEFGNHNIKSEYVWVLDPIDGTQSFLIGRPIFGTLIALVRNSRPILGIIDQPIGKERWLGANDSAFFNGKKIRSGKKTKIADSILSTTSKDLFSKTDIDFFTAVAAKAKSVAYGGDCYSYGLVASGFIDIVIESGLKVHDYAALAPIVIGAGGSFTDWQGKEVLMDGNKNVIAAANKKLLQQLLKLS